MPIRGPMALAGAVHNVEHELRTAPHHFRGDMATSDALGSCPYSEETMTGCRHYLPVSQHGGFPGAARCRLAMKLPTPDYIHQAVCRRRIVGGEDHISPGALPR